MSTTVTYKGETLTTVSNDTATLETGGTWLEDDITLTDVSGSTPTGTKNISITANGTTTEDVTNYATASITTSVPASAVDSGTKSISTNGTHDVIGYASASVNVPASAVDSGTKNISINSNGTTTEDVVGYASASITANVPNTYSASDEGKVVDNGALVSQTSDTVTENDTYDTTLINSLTVNVSGGGGVDLSWLASSTPTPSVRNFFYALSNGTAEHGEITLTSTTTSYETYFTFTNFSENNPPQGIVIIDKDFYQGTTTLPVTNSDALTLAWLDKSFNNPAADASMKYNAIKATANQSGTNSNNVITGSFIMLDGSTTVWRANWLLTGSNFQIKNQYGNNNQYTLFLRDRPYIWIAY